MLTKVAACATSQVPYEYRQPKVHVSWFNHFCEPDYNGPQYQVEDGAIVVGGGLPSLDVIKVLQIETVRLALERRGIRQDMLHRIRVPV